MENVGAHVREGEGKKEGKKQNKPGQVFFDKASNEHLLVAWDGGREAR